MPAKLLLLAKAAKIASNSYGMGCCKKCILQHPLLFCLKAVERSETKNHPLSGWGKELYKKAHQSITIRVFRPIAKER